MAQKKALPGSSQPDLRRLRKHLEEESAARARIDETTARSLVEMVARLPLPTKGLRIFVKVLKLRLSNVLDARLGLREVTLFVRLVEKPPRRSAAKSKVGKIKSKK